MNPLLQTRHDHEDQSATFNEDDRLTQTQIRRIWKFGQEKTQIAGKILYPIFGLFRGYGEATLYRGWM
jgi:hypothetical protein